MDLRRRILGLLKLDGGEKTFLKDFSITSLGSIINILATVVLTPIITRIYSPDLYGEYLVFMAIIGNIAVVGMFLYQESIIIPKRNEDAYSLVKLCLSIAFGVFSVVLCAFLFFSDQISSRFNLEIDPRFLLLIPFGVILRNLTSILDCICVREKEFKRKASSLVSTSLVSKLFAIGFGILFLPKSLWLILGLLAGQGVALTILFFSKTKGYLKEGIAASFSSAKTKAIEFINYPRYLLPGRFVNKFSTDLPLFVFSAVAGASFAGNFGFAISILGLSYSVLGSAMNPVFLHRANSLFNEDEKLVGPFVTKVYYGLFGVAVIPFTILAVFGDYIFPFIFGANWAPTGDFVRVLSYYILFRLIASPLTSVFRIYSREDLTLKINVILFVVRGISLLVGYYYFGAFGSVIAFSIANILVYILVSQWVFKLSNASALRPIATSIVVTALCYAVFYQLRLLILAVT